MDGSTASPEHADASLANDRLDSWKEIAAYLRRDVTTVRRWEKREGLPVQRHLHARRDSVYAFKADLDSWWEGRRNHLAGNGAQSEPPQENDNGSSESSINDLSEAPIANRLRVAWTVAAVFFFATSALITFLIVALPRGAAGGGEIRFLMVPPEETSFGSVSLSSDGRQLAFTTEPNSTTGGRSLLWIRSLDSTMARPLPDTEDAAFPFWSPNNDAVGFFAGGKLWIAPVRGGSPRIVCDAPKGRGGSWNRAGVILFTPDRENGIFRVSASGGTATPVTTVNRPAERGHVWPEFLPDGEHFLYLADSVTPEHHGLFVGDLDTRTSKLLIPRAVSNAVYNANGYLFFARERALVAQPFDASALAFTGEVITVVDRVQQPFGFDHKTDFSVSGRGGVVYRTMQSPATRLVWRDRTQHVGAFVSTSAEYYSPTLSPDETRIAVSLFDPRPSIRFGYGSANVRSDVWIFDRSAATASRLTSDPGAEWGPVWSPDSRSLVFSSNRSGRLALYHKDLESASSHESLLPTTGENPVAQSWSADGRFLLYAAFDLKMRTDLWLLPMTGDRIPAPLLRTEVNEMQGQISPDGRWFAYTADESGRFEVYVQSFPIAGSKFRISTDGGGDPRWSADRSELFYVADDRRLMAVPVKTGTAFEHGLPKALFDIGMPPQWYEARNLYDVSRDGRFLLMKPAEDDRSAPLTVILNWTAKIPFH